MYQRYKPLEEPSQVFLCTLRKRPTSTSRRRRQRDEQLGCTLQEAVDHLAKSGNHGETWDNYGKEGKDGKGKSHVDHIMPLSSVLNCTDKEAWLRITHWSNTQLLWADMNMRKGDTIPKDWKWNENKNSGRTLTPGWIKVVRWFDASLLLFVVKSTNPLILLTTTTRLFRVSLQADIKVRRLSCSSHRMACATFSVSIFKNIRQIDKRRFHFNRSVRKPKQISESRVTQVCLRL